MRGYLELLRPWNCVIAALAILIGAAIAVGAGNLGGSALGVSLVVLAGFVFTGAGNALNDFFDRESDRVNHPSRPIPSGRVAPGNAVVLASVLFFVALLAGAGAGPFSLVIVIVNMAAMVSYEVHFKRRGLSGNLVISWLVASLFIFGGAAVYSASANSLPRVAWLGLLAFLATLGREIVKDIEDAAGDIDRATLPKTAGVEKAGFLAAVSFVIGVALSPLPFTSGVLGVSYLALIVLADGIFIYCAWFSALRPSQVSRAAKYGMVIALIAFLAGGAL